MPAPATTGGGDGLRGCVWRPGTLACMALVAACKQGYPTADEPVKNPAVMTRKQLLVEMNRMGEQRHLEQQWRYRMKPDCVLEVRAVRDAGATQPVAVPLDGATIEVRVDDDDKTFEVQVRPADRTGQAVPVLVLEGGKWTDSVGMRSLLQHLQRHCGQRDEPGS